MAQTFIKTVQIGDGEVTRQDFNTTVSGKAVVAKIIQGTGITISSTGADSGTGDVTINASGSSSVVKGSANVDFGSDAGGTNYIVVPVTSAQVTGTSSIKAVIEGSTATHNIMEHLIVPFKVMAADIVNNTGFNLHVFSDFRLTGQFNCNYEIFV